MVQNSAVPLTGAEKERIFWATYKIQTNERSQKTNTLLTPFASLTGIPHIHSKTDKCFYFLMPWTGRAYSYKFLHYSWDINLTFRPAYKQTLHSRCSFIEIEFFLTATHEEEQRFECMTEETWTFLNGMGVQVLSLKNIMFTPANDKRSN